MPPVAHPVLPAIVLAFGPAWAGGSMAGPSPPEPPTPSSSTSNAPRAADAIEAPVALTSEPSHHLILTTDRVRIFRVEVPPHGSTLMHQHDRDYVWIALGDVDILNAVAGGAVTRVTVPDAGLVFARGGFAHVARNQSAAPFRNLTIEFLKPQTSPHNRCAPALRDQPTECAPGELTPPKGRRGVTRVTEFETRETRISLLSLEPRARFTIEPSASPPLLLALDGAEAEALVRLSLPGGGTGAGTRPLRTADALEVPPGLGVELRNTGERPARFLVLETEAG